jgi:hypothetical protein
MGTVAIAPELFIQQLQQDNLKLNITKHLKNTFNRDNITNIVESNNVESNNVESNNVESNNIESNNVESNNNMVYNTMNTIISNNEDFDLKKTLIDTIKDTK